MSTVTAEKLVSFALLEVTRKIQGSDRLLSYRFSGSQDPLLVRNVEKVLMRVDAELDIDIQQRCSCSIAEVNIYEFEGIAGVDPVTGRETINVGKATPNNDSWTIQWADASDATKIQPLDVLVHEWGHVLGLLDADSDDPLRTNTTSAKTVMSYNRSKSSPGRYFTGLDIEALTLLWGPETTPADKRAPFASGSKQNSSSSFAWEVQEQIDGAESNSKFVNSVYSTILERNVDPGAASWWTTALDQGLSRRAVVDTLLISEEFLEILVTT